MIEDNKDIFPDPTDVDIFSNAAPAIENPLTREAFTIYENRSNKARDTYIFWGNIAVWFIVLPAALTVCEALLIEYINNAQISKVLHYISIIGSCIAFLGIGIHALLYFRKTKICWIMNRFAAERVRSIHFQAFALGGMATSTSDLAAKVSEFSRSSLVALKQELNEGHAVFRRFEAQRSVASEAKSKIALPVCEPDLLAAYEILRVDYQHRFAMSEVERPNRGLQFKRFFSGFLYGIGAFSVVVTIMLKLFYPSQELSIAIFECLIIIVLAASLMERLFEQISIKHETIHRFKIYAVAVDKIATEKVAKNRISKMEIAALNELKSFCDDVDRVLLRL